MKVAVVSFSGNVGKTTVAVNLLKPRMKDTPIFSIESINIDARAEGIEVERMRGRNFGELQEHLMMRDDAIIDVGASNVEEFIKQMQQYAGSHEEFDYFIVPTVAEKKQLADTVTTIRTLSKIGIPRSKIRVVFNMVDIDDVVEDDFAPLIGLAELEKSFTINLKAVIYSNEVYDRLKEIGKSLFEIAADDTDYRAKLREASTDEEKEMCVKMVAIKRLAVTANKNLDDVYKALFR